MTDSSILLPNQVGLTSDCLYSLKPSAVRSRSYRASVLPTNKTVFNPTDTCIIYVPGGRRNTYLDVGQSYIRMSIKNNDINNPYINLDGCASSVINRIDVFHGSNLLETIQQYNVLANYILDMQASISHRIGLSNIYGFDSSGDRAGAKLGGGTTYGQFQTFCVPLFSGVVGVLADKMLPIGMLSDDIRIEITFEQAALGVVAANALSSNWTVQDFQLELCIVELSDEGEDMVRSITSPENPVYLHGSSWRHFTSILPNGTSGGFSTLVPARFASMKQLALCPRRNTDMVQNSYAINSRVNPNLQYYWWRIGSSVVPNKAIYLENSSNTSGYGEAYAELLKSWHSLHSITNSTCLGTEYQVYDSTPAGQSTSFTVSNNLVQAAVGTALTFASAPAFSLIPGMSISGTNVPNNCTIASVNSQTSITLSVATTTVIAANTVLTITPAIAGPYVQSPAAAVGANSYKNGFVIAQELESFAQRNDVLLSGMNTLASQVFFECQIGSATSTSYTLDFFAWYDHILILQDGILSVKF